MKSRLKVAATSVKTVITLQAKADGSPVAGALVVAFTDFANRIGAGHDQQARRGSARARPSHQERADLRLPGGGVLGHLAQERLRYHPIFWHGSKAGSSKYNLRCGNKAFCFPT